MIVPSYSEATAHSLRNWSSVPNWGSTCMLMRSKCPSTDGVKFQPSRPPACLIGPVWIASMPIVLNASHSLRSASADRNDSPDRVMNEGG